MAHLLNTLSIFYQMYLIHHLKYFPSQPDLGLHCSFCLKKKKKQNNICNILPLEYCLQVLERNLSENNISDGVICPSLQIRVFDHWTTTTYFSLCYFLFFWPSLNCVASLMRRYNLISPSVYFFTDVKAEPRARFFLLFKKKIFCYSVDFFFFFWKTKNSFESQFR